MKVEVLPIPRHDDGSDDSDDEDAKKRNKMTPDQRQAEEEKT
jgi:hypothetical protein